jgi:PAS domain S-box-containing protein
MNNGGTTDSASFLSEFEAPELLNLLADGAYITDTDRRIVFWNQAAQRITGWTPQEVVGRTCRDNILVHVDKDGHQLCGHEQCPLHRSIVTGQPSAEPVLVFGQHRSGSRIPVEVTVAPVRNHAGQIIGGIEVFRDLTASVQDQLRAKEIQEMAVQCELPEDDRVSFEMRYQPRDIVGGDFFRVEKVSEDVYAVFVADAKGHGVAAALYTMLLRSLWQEHRPDLESPARFMEIINDRLHGLMREDGFFGTAALVGYDAANGQLRLAFAGHPLPLLFRAGGAVETPGATGPALGMFGSPKYQEIATQLAPGDALLLYTDGATELFDDQDHELGREGLLKLVRAQVCAGGNSGFHLAQLEGQLLRFSNEIHLPDDLTMVKLCRLR